MNRYDLIIFIGLLMLVVALPVYALREPERMAAAQQDLRQQYVADGAVMYVDNCALCHGVDGSGIGAYPALNTDAIRNAEYDFLYKTIARGRYNTAMAAWHQEDGGPFNSYQVDELTAFLRYVDWDQVAEMAAQQGVIPPAMPVPDVTDDLLAQVAALGPEGDVWASGLAAYAENCTTCHGVNGAGTDLAPALNDEDTRTRDASDLARTIRAGVPGTMMPSWDAQLEDETIDALVAFLQHWDAIDGVGIALTPPAPIHIDPTNPEEMLALGESLYANACAACHGENGEGGSGPALNSLQILTRNDDASLAHTIIYGPRRPNSIMPAFGDRLTSVEVDALVQYLRSWEATAIWVENPRGTEQGGGPPWLRATPDPDNPIPPGQGGGPPAGRGPNAQAAQPTGPTLHFTGQVVSVMDNQLTFIDQDGVQRDAMLGPPWWWSEKGIELQPGDPIELEGFESPDHMEVNWIKNLRTGQRIDLRTPSGMPVWSGQS
jgi:cbb3-type cytochrome c oxidase subunit III